MFWRLQRLHRLCQKMGTTAAAAATDAPDSPVPCCPSRLLLQNFVPAKVGGELQCAWQRRCTWLPLGLIVAAHLACLPVVPAAAPLTATARVGPSPLLQVFLGGVSNDTNMESLQAYCGQWGELSDVHVMEGKGYAFVTFAAVPTAQAFLEVRSQARAPCHAATSSGLKLLLLNNPARLPLLQHREHYIDGRKVDAKAAVPRDQGGGKLTRKMFVGGIGEVSDAEFQAHFANFGTVTVRSSCGDARCCRRHCCRRCWCWHVCPWSAAVHSRPLPHRSVLCSASVLPAGSAYRTAWCCASPTAAPAALGL